MDSWGNNDSWGNAPAGDGWEPAPLGTQDAWGDDGDDGGFIPDDPNNITSELANLKIDNNDTQIENKNDANQQDENEQNKDANSNNSNNNSNNNNNTNEEKANESKSESKANNESENTQNSQKSEDAGDNSANKGKKKRKKKKSKGEKRRCTGCKVHFLKTEMTLHERSKEWYCAECAKKEKCMDCRKYVSPQLGKADDYGAWYCNNCWKKYRNVCFDVCFLLFCLLLD